MKLLLVEDDRADARFLRSCLARSEGKPPDLVHVECMRDAVAALRQSDFDVVLLDLHLPDASGETISFCLRAAKLGYPTHVHTGVRTSHLKQLWMSEVDYWNYRPAPPADTPVDIIVPTRNRPDNAAPFMASLRASTGWANVVAVVNDDDDSGEAWTQAGARVVNVGEWAPGDFARKMNLGYKNTTAPWIMLCGDDVRFHPGWLDHALHVGALNKVDVVGTNDLGNPRVVAGEHATHMEDSRDEEERQRATHRDTPK